MSSTIYLTQTVRKYLPVDTTEDFVKTKLPKKTAAQHCYNCSHKISKTFARIPCNASYKEKKFCCESCFQSYLSIHCGQNVVFA